MSWGVKLLGFNAAMDQLVDVQTSLEDNAVYVVGTNVAYSVYVEMGTRSMSPQPYLFPAAREVARSVERIAAKTGANSVGELIKAVALEIEALAKRFAPVDTGNLKASIRTERVR